MMKLVGELTVLVVILAITANGLSLSEDGEMKDIQSVQKRAVDSDQKIGDLLPDEFNDLCGDCKKSDDKPVTCPSKYLRNPHSNTCVRIIRTEKTWEDAKNYCIIAGERLATFATLESAFWLTSLRKTDEDWKYRDLWLGGKRTEGKWRWVDGALVDTAPWGDGEPSSRPGEEDCIGSREALHYRFNDSGCGTRLGFICELL